MSLRGRIASKAGTSVKLAGEGGNRDRKQVQRWPTIQDPSRRLVLAATSILLPWCWKGKGKESAFALDLPDLAKLVGGKTSKPGAIRIPRRQVNDQLAVACMRALYGTIEDLNIVAMNEYQKEFWTFRQSQQPEYLQIIEPLKPRVVR